MKNLVFVFALCLSFDSWAGVYKCTDTSGHTFYQSSPCVEQHKSIQINPKTGGSVDLTSQEQLQSLGVEQRKQMEIQQQAEENAKQQALTELKKQSQAESSLTQAMIKANPQKFSAYAIPTYDPEKLPGVVKPYEARLPEIERLRRLAAEKALETGKCQRVEADELNFKSKPDLLVFQINCSSGATFDYAETELKP